MRRQGNKRNAGRRAATALLAAWLAVSALPSAAAADSALWGRTIVVDPGHGGIDGGATGYGVVEKTVTLPISLDLGAMLRGEGAQVVFTRSSDVYVSLAQRVAIANAAGGDAFIAIHGNALNDPAYRGLTTYYGPSSGYVTGAVRSAASVAASRALAGDVQAAAVAQTGEINRGVQSADYYVLGGTAMPAILVETGFLTNPQESALLASPSFQSRVAAGIANGVTRYFVGARGSPATTPALPSSSPITRGYLVQPGDTLSGVAVQLGLTEASLAAANGITNDNRIVAGQTLAIPGMGGTAQAAPSGAHAIGNSVTGTAHYTVRRGDTLSAIAVRLGLTQVALARANGLQNSDLLLAGQRLALPEAGTTSGPSAAAASAVTAPSQRYKVRLGDTLSGIAARFGVTEMALAQANGIRDRNRVDAGTTLAIPQAS